MFYDLIYCQYKNLNIPFTPIYLHIKSKREYVRFDYFLFKQKIKLLILLNIYYMFNVIFIDISILEEYLFVYKSIK